MGQSSSRAPNWTADTWTPAEDERSASLPAWPTVDGLAAHLLLSVRYVMEVGGVRVRDRFRPVGEPCWEPESLSQPKLSYPDGYCGPRCPLGTT